MSQDKPDREESGAADTAALSKTRAVAPGSAKRSRGRSRSARRRAARAAASHDFTSGGAVDAGPANSEFAALGEVNPEVLVGDSLSDGDLAIQASAGTAALSDISDALAAEQTALDLNGKSTTELAKEASEGTAALTDLPPTTVDPTEPAGGEPEWGLSAPAWWARRSVQIGAVALLIAVGGVLRLVTALAPGTAVDELTYQYIGAYTWKHGVPTIRPEYGHATQPFLYHPPFFFHLLAWWFALWNNDSIVTARLLSVVSSVIALIVLYFVGRKLIGQLSTILVVFLLALDPWIIFTNRSVFIENSQMIIILLAMLALWYADRVDPQQTTRYVMRYVLAGALVGAVATYKQIGGYLFFALVINAILLTPKRWRGYVIAIVSGAAVFALYLVTMHLIYGHLFDSATITQIKRTFGARQSAGLNYGPATVVAAIVRTYFIYVTTIVSLILGAIAAASCIHRRLQGRRNQDPLVLSWAIAGILCGVGMALKSPHYFILWLFPLYFLVAQEAPNGIRWLRAQLNWSAQTMTRVLVGVLLLSFVLDLWTIRERFYTSSNDSLARAVTYINRHVPKQAIVATPYYIGALIRPQYVLPPTTRRALYNSGATYLAVYWSLTNPIPPALGRLRAYCVNPHIINGFNDHTEVCRLVLGRIVNHA
jgi:hypothetical protein